MRVFFYQNRKLKGIIKSQQHEDRLRTLYTAIGQSPVSVVIAGVDAHIRYVNPQFTEVTGYSPFEVIGQNPRMLSSGLTSPAVFQDVECIIERRLGQVNSLIGVKWRNLLGTSLYLAGLQQSRSDHAICRGKTGYHRTETARITRTFHNQVLELLSKGAPLKGDFAGDCAWVEAEYPNMMCSILLLDKEGKHLLSGAAPSLPEFYNEAINGKRSVLRVVLVVLQHSPDSASLLMTLPHPGYWAIYRPSGKTRLGACWSEPIYGSTKKCQARSPFIIMNGIPRKRKIFID